MGVINTEDYNCGGFAFRTFDWYIPYDYEDYGDIKVMYLSDKGLSNDEIKEIMLEDTIKHMLNEFGGCLRVIDNVEECESDEELIAYRISCNKDKAYFDFHFKVHRGDCWQEKNGVKEPHETDIEDWEHWPVPYDSDLIFLAHKI